MSDINLPDVPESDETEEDEVDVSFVNVPAMLMEEGIQISFPPSDSNLLAVLALHNRHARNANTLAEAAKKGIKKDDIETEVRASWKEALSESTIEPFPVSDLSEEIFSNPKDPLTLLVALRQLDELRENVKAQVDYLLMRQVSAEKVSRNIQETGDEALMRERATCKAIAETLRNLANMAEISGGPSYEPPTGLYVEKESGRRFLNVVDPPKSDGTVKPRGSNAQSRKVRYTWTNEYGTDTFEGISEEELCHEYLSTSTVRISRKQLDNALKAKGIKSVTNNGEEWSLTLVHGTLSGKLVK